MSSTPVKLIDFLYIRPTLPVRPIYRWDWQHKVWCLRNSREFSSYKDPETWIYSYDHPGRIWPPIVLRPASS